MNHIAYSHPSLVHEYIESWHFRCIYRLQSFTQTRLEQASDICIYPADPVMSGQWRRILGKGGAAWDGPSRKEERALALPPVLIEDTLRSLKLRFANASRHIKHHESRST